MNIFIVEDDIWFAEILEYNLLLNPDNKVTKFATGQDVLDNLHKRPDLISLDYSLPDYTGAEIFARIKKQYPDLPVVIVSGQDEVKTAISLLKEGAYDYITKDDEVNERLWNVVKNLKEHVALKKEVQDLRQEVTAQYDIERTIIGKSVPMQKVIALMKKAVDNDITVSLTGETGTGKEVVAQCIHFNSPFRDKPFVAVNLAAIPKDLVESELFGHEKGAFTGAHNKRIGKFEEANKGTIFLDEIAEMDLSLQAKLLRVLQEREVTRVGSNKVVKINVRIIVATHRNLAKAVAKGTFREDLYYRLLGLPIQLPPLRERGHDIILFAKEFLDQFCKKNKKEKMQLTEGAKKKLLSYKFPGNVREIKSVVELSAVMADGIKIDTGDIIFNSADSPANFLDRETTLRNYTNTIISHFMEKYDNDIPLVANKLDIGKSTIYKLLKNEEIVMAK